MILLEEIEIVKPRNSSSKYFPARERAQCTADFTRVFHFPHLPNWLGNHIHESHDGLGIHRLSSTKLGSHGKEMKS